MKKLILVSSMVMMSLFSFAQDFAEEDLAGTWELVESSGEFVYKHEDKISYSLACPDELKFYTEDEHKRESLGVARIRTSDQYTREMGMQDYFIYMTIGGNLRLHIQYGGGHYIVRYIVLEISQDKMELMTYDKKGRLTYRRKGSTNVRGIKTDGDMSKRQYNLKGEMISTSTKGIKIMQQKDGTTKKVLVK